MASDDLFKRYLEIGASILGMSRERAESIVRDLVASGEVAKSQATKDDLARLQAQVEELQGAATPTAAPATKRGAKAAAKAPAPAGVETRKAAAAAARKSAGTTARKSAGTTARKAATKAAPATEATGATRPAPRKRSGRAAPPAGGADPAKG